MRATVHIGPHDHQQQLCGAMARGLEKHGVKVTISGLNEPRAGDFAVVWGWKQDAVIKAASHVLVMERGHVGERLLMTSCGWDGLGRRGRYPVVDDDGRRWRDGYEHLMKPWRWAAGASTYALIIGQVAGDAALGGTSMLEWAEDIARQLKALGWAVRYRPHPMGFNRAVPVGAPLVHGSLAEALAYATVCVTFNSTAGVDAVLAGVPTYTLDAGAMAWPVTAHVLSDKATTPARAEWAEALAWSQWSETELETGEAWAHLAPLMEAL